MTMIVLDKLIVFSKNDNQFHTVSAGQLLFRIQSAHRFVPISPSWFPHFELFRKKKFSFQRLRLCQHTFSVSAVDNSKGFYLCR